MTTPTTSSAEISALLRGNNSPEVDAILDAAEAQFSEVGIRLTTVNDIARRAGVGRVTVYRRVGSVDDVAAALTARSASRLLARIIDNADAAQTVDELIGDVFADTILDMRTNAVWNRMLTLEPETSLTKMTIDAGDILAAATWAVTTILDSAITRGLVDPIEDIHGRAELLVRLTHSVVMTPSVLMPLETREELAAFAHDHLVPLIVA